MLHRKTITKILSTHGAVHWAWRRRAENDAPGGASCSGRHPFELTRMQIKLARRENDVFVRDGRPARLERNRVTQIWPGSQMNVLNDILSQLWQLKRPGNPRHVAIQPLPEMLSASVASQTSTRAACAHLRSSVHIKGSLVRLISARRSDRSPCALPHASLNGMLASIKRAFHQVQIGSGS